MNGALCAHTRGRDVAEVLAAALNAVEPRAALRNSLRRKGHGFHINAPHSEAGAEQFFELGEGGRVIVVGAGKACAPMTEAAVEILGDLIGAGIVIVKEGHLGDVSGGRVGPVELREASHPAPDARGVEAAQRMAALLETATASDIALALISGGGSALLTLPAEGLTLEDARATTALLLRCGATINEINALRKHCARLGGGGVARLAAPARVVSLIISDVVGSPLHVIASGPTAPDPTTYADAWRVVERYNLQAQLPARVSAHLRRGMAGELAETPKPGDESWRRTHNHVIADNRMAAAAAVAAARARGFDATLGATSLEGEARAVGREAAAIGRELRARIEDGRPIMYVLGGETTVTLDGEGWGGRNQELALGAVEALDGAEGVMLVSLATDGGDGPTDAAGAVVTGETLARARALGYDAGDFLQRHDAYNFFAPLDALLRPGPTLTNVNDLLFIVATAPASKA